MCAGLCLVTFVTKKRETCDDDDDGDDDNDYDDEIDDVGDDEYDYVTMLIRMKTLF